MSIQETDTPASGEVVVLPWPCSGCGERHDRKRTYYFGCDWYVCACGRRTPREGVLKLKASL